ncbi:MAG: hypothetical protein EAZ18_00255 [Oscillatoriales cyanobacterium]|nr:MAG: hypothetical protein EAZ18_00255 [Oscillatoriales cyanobacterium]
MFYIYTDVIIIVAVLGFFVIFFFVIWKYSEINILKKEVNKIKSSVLKATQRISLLEVSSVKVLNIITLNVDNIECNKQQIAQIQKYLVDVLQVSNLIGCAERDIEPSDLIEELRSRVEWAREIEKQKNANPSEYYEGK